MLTDTDNSNEILIIGAGGHAKVVVDAIQVSERFTKIIIADDDPAKAEEKICDVSIVFPIQRFINSTNRFHIAIGSNLVRQQIANLLLDGGLQYFTIVHRNASVSPKSDLEEGIFIAAQSVVAPHSSICVGAIVNHGAIVDHDCYIGAFTHIAPNVTLGGGVRVGQRVLLGAGATVLPGVNIGDDCTVGAGSVVNRDIESGMVVWGVPAVIHKK